MSRRTRKNGGGIVAHSHKRMSKSHRHRHGHRRLQSRLGNGSTTRKLRHTGRSFIGHLMHRRKRTVNAAKKAARKALLNLKKAEKAEKAAARIHVEPSRFSHRNRSAVNRFNGMRENQRAAAMRESLRNLQVAKSTATSQMEVDQIQDEMDRLLEKMGALGF